MEGETTPTDTKGPHNLAPSNRGYRTNQHAEPGMTLLSLFALVLPAALVAPKATKREAQLAEQWEREIQLNRRLQTAGQTARLEALETECAASGARGEAWRQAELDASEPEQPQHAFELAGECTAIVTNTLHNTKEASA